MNNKRYTIYGNANDLEGVQEAIDLVKEIERLNNIINELEKRLISDKKFFEDAYKKSHLSEEEFRKQCPYTIGSYDHSIEMLGKLQELKGDSSNDSKRDV